MNFTSESKLYISSWLARNLYNRLLKQFTVSALTTWPGKEIHTLTTLLEKKYFCRSYFALLLCNLRSCSGNVWMWIRYHWCCHTIVFSWHYLICRHFTACIKGPNTGFFNLGWRLPFQIFWIEIDSRHIKTVNESKYTGLPYVCLSIQQWVSW